jgi:hypothetical protein
MNSIGGRCGPGSGRKEYCLSEMYNGFAKVFLLLQLLIAVESLNCESINAKDVF